MFKFKKSQAALEFLTTYAWAFLVILVMVGALAYFGILSPSKLLPDRCNFGSELGCDDYKLSISPNDLNIKLKNNVGEPIAVSAFAITSEGSTVIACSLEAGFILPASWAQGTDIDFKYDCSNWAAAGFISGQKGKVLVTVTYNTVKSGTGYPHKVQGEVFATVQ